MVPRDQVNARLRAEDLAALRQVAEADGQTISSYVRKVLLAAIVEAQHSERAPRVDVVANLRRLADNPDANPDARAAAMAALRVLDGEAAQ